MKLNTMAAYLSAAALLLAALGCVRTAPLADHLSADVAQALAAEHGPVVPIRVFHLEDVGPSAARRFGFTQARGRYVVPLDADDKMAPEFLERTVPVLDADPMLGFVYTDTVYFGDTNQRQYQPDYNFKRLCQDNCPWSALHGPTSRG